MTIKQGQIGSNCPPDLTLTPGTPWGIREHIAQLETELAALRQQQRRALVDAITLAVGPGVAFSARELWEHRAASLALAAAFTDAGIQSARQLGKRLRQLCGSGLERVGADHDGAVWTVSP